MIATDYVFGRKRDVVPVYDITSDTFLANTGTTDTAAKLATALGINVSAITDFIRERTDIYCRISAPYNFSSTTTTMWKDVQGNGQIISGRRYLRTGMTVFYSPSVHDIGQGAFFGCKSLKYCIIPNVQTVTPNSFNEKIFNLDPGLGHTNLNHLTVCFPLAWQTSNNGGYHPEVQYVVDNGGTVTFGDIENYEFLLRKPSKITTLQLLEQKGTMAKYSFAAPASFNTISRYELYINGVWARDIQPGNNWIALDQPLTQHTLTIQAVDIYFNRSLISNSVTFTTESEPYPGLHSVYQLQDTTPGVITDSYGNAHGTIEGTYNFSQPGKIANSIYLGAGCSIRVPNRGIYLKASFNFWLKKDFSANNTNSGFTRFSNGGATSSYRYGNNTIYIDNFTSTRKTIGAGNIADISAAMHMVTVTADQTTNVWKFYQNAVLVFTSTVGDLRSTIFDVFEIGRSGGTNFIFAGNAEQALFFHKALTQSEIDYWYNGGLGRVPQLT